MIKTLQKLISVLLVVLMCISAAPLSSLVGLDFDIGVTASAIEASGKVGENVSYTFNSSTGLLTLSGTGTTYDYPDPSAGGLIDAFSPFYTAGVSSEIKEVVVGEGITTIGAYLFHSNRGVTKVTLPKTLKEIGKFSFVNNQTLTSIEIPEGVTTIDEYAFHGCNAMTSVSFPKSLTSIGRTAFYNTSIKTVYYNGLKEEWDSNVTIGENNEKITNATFEFAYDGKLGDNILYKLNKTTGELKLTGSGDTPNYSVTPFNSIADDIKSVTIGEGITGVGDKLFSTCTEITAVTLPSTLSSIGAEAFNSCKSLASINIPQNVSQIGVNAFYNCSALKSVTLPEKITEIKTQTFYGCTSLTSIIIPEKVESIGNGAFKSCKSLTSVTVPSKVTTIGANAFEGCVKLTGIALPESVTSIGNAAFYGCTALKNIVIPNEITEIKENTFFNCTALTSITLPKGITSIGTSAFDGCTALQEVHFLGTKTEWSSVTISTGNDPLTNAKIYFADLKLGDNVYYYLNETTGLLTIAGSGPMYSGEITTLNSNSSIKEVVIADGVTTIGESLFDSCKNLSKVTLPSSIESIGSFAFCFCTSLTEIKLPEGVKSIGTDAFYSTKIKSLTIPSTVSDLTAGSLESMNELESITVADGNANFASVNGVLFNKAKTTLILYPLAKVGTKYAVPGSVTEISRGAFDTKLIKTIVIPSSVKKINSFAFSDCSNLSEVFYFGTDAEWNSIDIGTQNSYLTSATRYYADGQLGDNVYYTLNASTGKLTVFGEGVTYSNSNSSTSYFGDKAASIKNIEMMDGITELKMGIFSHLTALESVTFPETTLTYISDRVFVGCTSLKSVTLPDSLTDLGQNVFYNCTSLESIHIGKKLYFTPYSPFGITPALKTITVDPENTGFTVVDGVLFTKNMKLLMRYPAKKAGTSYTVPDGVVTLCDYSFSDCNLLESVKIADTVGTIRSYAFHQCTSLKSIKIPEGITELLEWTFVNCSALETVELPSTMKKFSGAGNFQKCTALVSINIPDGFTSFGDQSFYNCTSLKTFEMPDTVTNAGAITFNGCTSLETVKLSKNLTTLGRWGLFYGCTSLKNVEIPSKVTSINTSTFRNCTSLESITLPDGLQTLGNEAFAYCKALTSITIPGEVTSVGSSAFSACYALKTVSIASKDTAIGENAFASCSAISDVYFGGTEAEWNTYKTDKVSSGNSYLTNATFHCMITSGSSGSNVSWTFNSISGELIFTGTGYVPTEVFDGRADIKKVTIAGNIVGMQGEAFYDCANLNTVSIQSPKFQYMNTSYTTFAKCFSLERIIVTEDNPYVDSRDNCNAIISTSDNTLLFGCKGTVIPETVTSIADYAFYRNGVTEITIPGNVKTLGDNVFSYCSNLKSVTFEEGVTTIGESTFYECTSLTDVKLADSISSIGYASFKFCTALTTLTFPKDMTVITNQFAQYDYALTDIVIPDGITKIGSWAFDACRALKTVVIPKSVTEIGKECFYGCNSLEDILYLGTSADWEKVSVGENNSKLTEKLRFAYDEGQIGNNAYYRLDNTTGELSITGEGDTYYYLEASPLSGNTAIKTVTIGKGINSLGGRLFDGCTGITSVNLSDTTSEISGFAFNGCTSLKSITIPSSVYEIDYHAFAGCSSLETVNLSEGLGILQGYCFGGTAVKSITIPKSVTSMVGDSFADCKQLESINVAEGNQTYISVDGVVFTKDMTALVAYPVGKAATKYEIPNTVTNINYAAFNTATNLKTITVPTGVTEIKEDAFKDSALTDIYFDGSNTEWNNIAIDSSNTEALNNITIHFTTEEGQIGENVFYTLDPKTGVLTITGEGAIYDYSERDNVSPFENSNTVKTVTIGEGVTSIGNRLFAWCSELESVELPSTLDKIGDSAFVGSSLKSIEIPASVTDIASTAFKFSKLASIVVDEANSQFASVDGVLFTKDMITLVAYPAGKTAEEYIIPDTVKYIDANAFAASANLKKVTFPASIESIGCGAFPEGAGLTDVYYIGGVVSWNKVFINTDNEALQAATMHYSIESGQIGENVYYEFDKSTGVVSIVGSGKMYDYNGNDNRSPFYSRNDVKSVTIAEGVESIGSYLFLYNSNLKSITLPNGLLTIGERPFVASAIEELNIPASVTEIGRIGEISSLTSITVDKNNTVYSSVDGVLFNKDVTTLIYYPAAKPNSDYTIPDTVTIVKEYSFVLGGSETLKSMTIPTSVEYLESNMLIGGYSLTDVYYLGSKAQWDQIIGDPFSYYTTIHYALVSGQIGNDVYYDLNTVTGVLNITGEGETYDYTSGYNPPFNGFSNIKTINVGEDVTYLGDCLFWGCDSVETINLPSSLECLGEDTFANTGIMNITVAEDSEFFVSVDGILYNKEMTTLHRYPSMKTDTEFIIPATVELLDCCAFYYATALKTVTIPFSVTYIDDNAFEGCNALTDVYYDGSAKQWNERVTIYEPNGSNYDLLNATFHYSIESGKIGDNVYYEYNSDLGLISISGSGKMYDYDENNLSPFANRMDIRTVNIEGAENIGAYMFYNCSGLEEVTISNSVTTIGSHAFYGCRVLGNVNISSYVKEIGASAFMGCTNLTSAVLGEGVEKIGETAFMSSGLYEISIPSTVKSIGKGAFADCLSFSSITVDDNNANYTVQDGILFDKNMTTLVQYPAAKTGLDYTVPETVKVIGEYGFSHSYLRTITMSSLITEIKSEAFSACDSLTDVYYLGTKTQWNEISIGEGNDSLRNATIHCEDEAPTITSIDGLRPMFAGFNRFTVELNGHVNKLQVIYPNGSTATFNNYSNFTSSGNVTGVVSITAYDKDGNEVRPDSSENVREIWVLNLNLAEGDYQIKTKSGGKWRAAKDFTVELDFGAKVESVKINGTANGGFNKYAVKVVGKASKIQVITANGGTYTFDRNKLSTGNNSSGVVSIKAYDRNGNEVVAGSDEAIYELWVINMALKEGEYTAKAKFGSTWEATGKVFTVSYPTEPLAEVKVVEAVGESGSYSFKVNGTAEKLQIVTASGATYTYTKSSSNVGVAYYDESGNEVDRYSGDAVYEAWTVAKNFADGEYSAIVKYDNGITKTWGNTTFAFDIADGVLTTK